MVYYIFYFCGNNNVYDTVNFVTDIGECVGSINSCNQTDVDECAQGIDGCAQLCTNVAGGYFCSCGSGYRLASDNHTCNGQSSAILHCTYQNSKSFILYTLESIDVDECAEGVAGCVQICTNIVGGFFCSCGDGYRIASNGRDCVDVDECLEDLSRCSQTCTNSIGSYNCSCGSGYVLAGDEHTCTGT